MWKSAYVGVYQLLNWKMHGETLKFGGGKVFSPTHRPPLPPVNIPGSYSLRGWVDTRVIVQPKGLCRWKFPMTPSGIEPATYRLLTQCLNQLPNRVSPDITCSSVLKCVTADIGVMTNCVIWKDNLVVSSGKNLDRGCCMLVFNNLVLTPQKTLKFGYLNVKIMRYIYLPLFFERIKTKKPPKNYFSLLFN